MGFQLIPKSITLNDRNGVLTSADARYLYSSWLSFLFYYEKLLFVIIHLSYTYVKMAMF